MKPMARAAGYLLFAAIIIVFVVARPISSKAEIFKFVDRDGAIHYTNAPTSVQSTLVNLPPLTQVNFRKYFPTYKGYQGYQPGVFSPLSNLPNQAAYDPHIKLTCKLYGLDCNLVSKAAGKIASIFRQAFRQKPLSFLLDVRNHYRQSDKLDVSRRPGAVSEIR